MDRSATGRVTCSDPQNAAARRLAEPGAGAGGVESACKWGGRHERAALDRTHVPSLAAQRAKACVASSDDIDWEKIGGRLSFVRNLAISCARALPGNFKRWLHNQSALDVMLRKVYGGMVSGKTGHRNPAGTTRWVEAHTRAAHFTQASGRHVSRKIRSLRSTASCRRAPCATTSEPAVLAIYLC